MVILLDMDEVLVDFVGGAAKEWGVTRPALLAHWQPDDYDMLPALTKCLGLPQAMTLHEFWEPFLCNEQFWMNLQPQPWFHELWQTANRIADRDVYVVSDPGPCHSGLSGKLRFLRHHIGRTFDRLVATPHKHLLASRRKVLVDDSGTNILNFSLFGGRALMFPAPWNKVGQRLTPETFVETLEQRIRNLSRS